MSSLSPALHQGHVRYDHLSSSAHGVAGTFLPAMPGKFRVRVGRSGGSFTVMAAKIKKGKKGKEKEYPWPDKIPDDDTVSPLSYLSRFKPLKEKPKQVLLPFEKPIADLERKMTEAKELMEKTGVDFSLQISQLEEKYKQVIEELYTNLTPIQRVSVARHPNRPTCLDHVQNISDKWMELHGDRAGYDDPAIVTGIASIDGISYMFVGHQKGRNTKENIYRNFAMPSPHGYRKAMRIMKEADDHGIPIVTFIDTPGAFADIQSEQKGQGEAIAYNLREMFGLKVPIVTVVIGEGGSGGALAIGCANKMLMLENSVYYVASPEACAAILYKDSKASPKAAARLRITAPELVKFKIADEVIPEPLGGAHVDPVRTSKRIKEAVVRHLRELINMTPGEVEWQRWAKFRAMGRFQEVEIDDHRKRNMKKRDALTEPIHTDMKQDTPIPEPTPTYTDAPSKYTVSLPTYAHALPKHKHDIVNVLKGAVGKLKTVKGFKKEELKVEKSDEETRKTANLSAQPLSNLRIKAKDNIKREDPKIEKTDKKIWSTVNAAVRHNLT
uniref:acetyl-CoA carboxytransferase n=1 Tax=Araucaria cunninghamii TaxID=56994 RepID=A0A0D6QSU5_ARACU